MPSIRHRIQLGFAVVLILHGLTAAMAHIGLARSRSDLTQLDTVAARTLSMVELDRTVVELQRSVGVYMLTGHAGAADRVRELTATTRATLAAAETTAADEIARERLSTMRHLVRQYEVHFDTATVDRQRQGVLIHEMMRPSVTRLLSRVTTMAESHPDSPAAAAAAATASARLLAVERTAMQYFQRPLGRLVDTAIQQTHELDAALADLATVTSGDAAPLHAQVEQFRRAFLEAVQSTRGYLHLVNVVLAGEAAELLHQSAEVRTASLRSRDQLAEAIRARMSRIAWITDLISALAIIVGIIAAAFIARGILRPMLGMTRTLGALARGDREASIDGLGRRDEIGDMAAAAEVFRQRNIETEQLLAESCELTQDLQRRNVEMTQFVHTVSHDLKSPLLTMQWYVGYARQRLAEEPGADVGEDLDFVEEAADRLCRTIDDLLELSRIGLVARDPAPCDLRSVVLQLSSELATEIARTGAVIALADDAVPVHADPLRLRQVLQNLIVNALRHGRPVAGTPRIRISSHPDGDGVRLEVTDNGPGIPAEYHDRIFELFQRLDPDAAGTGVGLSIVRRVAEAHGGTASIRTTPDPGLTIAVHFPSAGARLLTNWTPDADRLRETTAAGPTAAGSHAEERAAA
jgi:signal transduction histidine kinase